MNTLLSNIHQLFSLKSFQVYLPFIFLIVLCMVLISFTMLTGAAQVLNYLGLYF